MKQLIQFPDKHAAAFGTTQTGKTYGVQKSLLAVPEGVIFFNVNHAGGMTGYTMADRSQDIEVILSALREGEKINYMPSREYRWLEMAIITEAILETGKLNCRVVFDECHLMYNTSTDKQAKRKAQAAAEEIATTGLSKGMRAVYITQRPALMDNTLMTQAEYKIFYRTENEGPYLQRYGVPHEDLIGRLNVGGDYAYCTYYRGELDGAHKV